jgi:hypothetical protein
LPCCRRESSPERLRVEPRRREILDRADDRRAAGQDRQDAGGGRRQAVHRVRARLGDVLDQQLENADLDLDPAARRFLDRDPVDLDAVRAAEVVHRPTFGSCVSSAWRRETEKSGSTTSFSLPRPIRTSPPVRLRVSSRP